MSRSYLERVVDQELNELLPALSAVSIEGPRGVGKTATAQQRARTILALDDPAQRELLAADPSRLDTSLPPVLIDEWQRHPASWDLVRRSVDQTPEPGRFILTGSGTPREAPAHSGAGRIVSIRMRPMTLLERGVEESSVSLATLLAGGKPLDGTTDITLREYAEEIVASGFPAVRPLPGRARRAQLDGYLQRIVERDLVEQGVTVRRPATLFAWLAAYAAATATTASYSAILDAATPGLPEKPARSTTTVYRDTLDRLWLLDPIPAWLPTSSPFTRLGQAPKHHLADPALAARLLGLDLPALLSGETKIAGGLGTSVGALFESLVALQLRVFSQAAEATLHHLRTRNGDHEIDFIIQKANRKVIAVEVKLSPEVTDRDVAHLHWLRREIGDDLIDSLVVTTGPHAYRRPDGIGVVPAALLGP